MVRGQQKRSTNYMNQNEIRLSPKTGYHQLPLGEFYSSMQSPKYIFETGKYLVCKVSGGGDRTRTCIAFRPAVFKTAALPLCDPSARFKYNLGLWLSQTNACRLPPHSASGANI